MTREEEIEARLSQITGRPWRAAKRHFVTIHPPNTIEEMDATLAVVAHPPASAHGLVPNGILFKADAEFIAHAPDDVEYLLGEVKRLRALLDKP